MISQINRLPVKVLVLSAVVIVAVISSALAYLLMHSSGLKESREISLDDSCGPAFGRIMHTIKDADACSGRCQSGCVSAGMNYRKYSFTGSNDVAGAGCNICRCFCS